MEIIVDAEERSITVDGEKICFDFYISKYVKKIVWSGHCGYIDYLDGRQREGLTSYGYDSLVSYFLREWYVARAKRQA